MGTDLVPVTPSRPRRQSIEITEATLVLWQRQADMIADSDFVPGNYRGKPANIIAAAMLGASLGWPLMHSLQNIYSWMSHVNEKVRDPDTGREGWVTREQPTTAISSAAKLSLLIEAGHTHEVLTHTHRCVILRGTRHDRLKPYAVELTIDDPDLAHLVGRKMWQQHPRRMLWWRAVSELVTIMCPEVVMGITANAEDAPTSDAAAPPAPALDVLDVLERVPVNAIRAGAPATVSGTVAGSEAPADGGAFPLQPSAGAAPIMDAGFAIVAEAPATVSGAVASASDLDEMLTDIAPQNRAEAKRAVFDAVGRDALLAADCWTEMTSRLPWAAYDDPGAWARAWLSTRVIEQAAAPQDVEQAEADAPRCEYRGRDGRRCTRDPHDGTNHRLEPKTWAGGGEDLPVSGADANSGGAGPADPTPPDPHSDGTQGHSVIPDGRTPGPSETSGGVVDSAPHSDAATPPEPDGMGWDDGLPPGAEPARGPSGRLL